MSATETDTTVESWLAGRILAYGKKEAGDFTFDTDFSDIGLDSVYALTLCGDIEDEYDLEIDPEMLWDYSSIRSLADKLRELGAV